MKLRNRDNPKNEDNRMKVGENSESSDDSDASDVESDEELKQLASNVGQIFQQKLGFVTPSPQSGSDQNTDSALFVIDKKPSTGYSNDDISDEDTSDEDTDNSGDEESTRVDGSQSVTVTREHDGQSETEKTRQKKFSLSSSLNPGMDTSDLYVNVNAYHSPKLHNSSIDNLLLKSGKKDGILQKSVITKDFEKQHEVPTAESFRQQKKKRRAERANTSGGGWFDMCAQEMTEAKKNDLMVLHMRRALDPKRFYKAPDIKALPKFFQIGTVMDSPAEFYTSRVPKKQRKATLVDELLADAEFRKYNKRKYTEIVEAKQHSKGAFKHMRRLKKKKR